MGDITNEYDIITGAHLYDYFIGRVEGILAKEFEPDKYVLVSTDISNFKYINRIYGFDKANELLRSLIDVISDNEQYIVDVCRTHSDHIISLFKCDTDRTDFTKMVETYSENFIKMNADKVNAVALHLNNGIYFLEDAEEDILYSIDKVNVARRRAKGNYSVASVLYSDDMLKGKEEDAKVIALFEDAMRNDRVKVFYQPKINIVSGRIEGAEALSRLYDRNNIIIQPDEFIPVLENSGKIVELDIYVMKEVFSTIRKWIDESKRPVVVSINLSRMHFYNENVADDIYNIFKEYDIPVKYIEFELTESLFFNEADRIKYEVSKLRQYGFKISMDDFGVGYSNLNSLGELPVDIIKFDKGFVKSGMSNDSGFQILHSLIDVFKKINYNVICEGIETKADEKMIFECGCDLVQGFLYDKPMESEVFENKYIRDIGNIHIVNDNSQIKHA